MSNTIECNNCRKPFALATYDFKSIEEGDLHVDYISCPECGEKYLFFVSDQEMRDLVRRRRRIADQIKAGHAKHFKKKTLDGYMREMDKIRAKQKEIYPPLKERGQALLHKRYGKEDAGAEPT